MPNQPQRFAPGKGIDVPQEKRDALTEATEQLRQVIDGLNQTLKSSESLALLPDVEIFYYAVHYALVHDIFFEEEDIETAERFIGQGQKRAEQLSQGNTPWTTATGLMVRGYRSQLDDTIQPYGLIVPESFAPASNTKHRLDIWHHGRGAKLSELRFIDGQQKNPGEFTPDDTFMLHTYGRWSNAMKFAGEVDTFEALGHAKSHYPIDEDRICVRGFSMGGAATWHQAVHHADTWAAANAGAGFAETAVYQNVFAKEPPHPPLWEQKLWNMYDATVWAGNLYHCPTIAYSGEIDKQMQASNIMAEYMAKEGLELPHIIGPGMGHKYHPDSKVEVSDWLAKVVAKGRNRSPEKIRFTTFTLRYNRLHWVTVDSLEKHWERAQFNADVEGNKALKITTQNITAFTLDTEQCPIEQNQTVTVQIDKQELPLAKHYTKRDGKWEQSAPKKTLCKKHGSQGPIDDGFMESFVIVTPTGASQSSSQVTDWIADQQTDAIYQWEMQFRGRPRVKADSDVTDEDITNHNLALWGDPKSNTILSQIIDKLPIQWDSEQITVGSKKYASNSHVPVFIFPNPLNPKRYVIINSGFTFAPNGAQSNSTQTPKLPDWAIIDITKPSDDQQRVITADFFGERWDVV